MLNVRAPYPPESCKVYTPAALAAAMVQALDDRNGDQWLEPCVGPGVFLYALAGIEIGPRRITAIDLDPEPGPADDLARTVRGTDFLEWSKRTKTRFDRIVGNPPYLAIRKLPPALRSIAAAVTDFDGQTIGLTPNCWYAFFCASLRLLRRGGGVCFVLPAAWDFATYAVKLRNFLNRSFSRIEIHRSARPLFEEVKDGCIVLIADGFGGENGSPIRYDHRSPSKLIDALQVRGDKREASALAKHRRPSVPSGDLRVGDVMELRLGGVTGDADFFLLTESERRERGLPISCLRPVLSKARHLVGAEISKETWGRLRDTNERVWLFDPSDQLLENTAVRRYMELDSAYGGCRRDRYKVKVRDPWYRTHLPPRVEGFISGMSQTGPWIALNNMPQLTATNTLYTVRFQNPQTLGQRAAWALSFLASHTMKAMKSVRRTYADGLVKYEPGDLADLPILAPQRVSGARKSYSKAIRSLLSGDARGARRIADSFVALD